MAHVFISYKRENKDFAQELAQQLKDANFDYWMDERIPPSKKWRDEIDKQIWASFALVLVVTPEALKSEPVNYEWIFALGARVEVIPLYLQTVQRFPYRLGDIQYTDFRERYKWSELTARLKEIEIGLNQRADHIPAFVTQCKGRLEDPDPNVRKNTIDELAKSDHPAALDTIAVNGVGHHMRDVRINSAFKLMEITDPPDERALPGLLEALADQNDRTREKARREILKFGEQAVPGLISVLSNEFSEAQYCAAVLLGEFKAQSAVPKLTCLLNDNDLKVVDSAVNALGAIGDSTAIPPLRENLHDPHETRQLRVAEALVKCGDKGDLLLSILSNLLRNSDTNISESAKSLLVEIGEVSLPVAIKALRDEKPMVRARTIQILGELKSRKVVPRLVEALDDNNDVVRAESLTALANIGATEACHEVASHLDDANVVIQESAAWAVGQLKCDDAVEKLIELLSGGTKDLKVLVNVIRALAEIRDPGTVANLIPFLSDFRDTILPTTSGGFAQVSLNKLALWALEDIGTPEALEAIEKWRQENDESD